MSKQVLTRSCVLFTVMVALYSLINLVLYSSNSESFLALSSLRVFLFYPFSLLLSLSYPLFFCAKLDAWLRTVLHYMITMVGVYLFLILPLGLSKVSGALMGLLLFTFLYILLALIFFFIHGKLHKKSTAEDYTPVYHSADKK